MKNSKIYATVEAVLFASGEPLEAEKIAIALEVSTKDVLDAIGYICKKYEDNNSGIAILELGGKFQMVAKKEFLPDVKKVLDIKKNAPLSPAAFEVLAVIAYNQPTTKAFADQVRGVDCGGVINSLCEKGLIEEKGRLDLPGKPLVYGTTSDFLRCFSLNSLAQLPPLPKQENVLEDKVQESEQ